ncbi:MAG: CopD family protein [Burkholderiales bacterium]|nr:CopD family protein [Burkholderiales bacterium]
MTAVLFTAFGIHLAACVLATGAFFLLLLAGLPATGLMCRWERQVLSGARWLVLVALGSGAVWLAARTALFEGRPDAALDPHAIRHAMLDTWPGVVWMARHGLLVVLAAFLFTGGDVSTRWNWIAARAEALVLAALALILLGGSSHAAAISDSLWPRAFDMVHLLGAGIWAGSLPPLALLIYAASRGPGVPDPYAVQTMRSFSRIALVAVLVLAGSGIASATLLVKSVAGLMGTTHGHLLLAKLAVLIAALVLAAANRALLPALSGTNEAKPSATARRMALFIAMEAGLVVLLLGLAGAMTLTTPAAHGDPVWPFPIRLSVDTLLDLPVVQVLAQLRDGLVLAGLGLGVLAIAFLTRRRRKLLSGLAFMLVAGGAAVTLAPLVVEAYPTSYLRPSVTYNAGSIAEGMSIYQARCASCHATRTAGSEALSGSTVDRLAPLTARQTAGELFWLITHGELARGMPEFGSLLGEVERWHVINFIRAFAAARDPRPVGTDVETGRAWLAAPDFNVSVGPLTPRALRDYRGQRVVLLVLYDLPQSRTRMAELARRYGALSVLGVEIVAVPPRASPEAIAELGALPPVLFPVVTNGNEAIVSVYRLFTPGTAHAELLIDRQGYIRAIWRDDLTAMPDPTTIQAQVERLNEEKAPPPIDHVH